MVSANLVKHHLCSRGCFLFEDRSSNTNREPYTTTPTPTQPTHPTTYHQPPPFHSILRTGGLGPPHSTDTLCYQSSLTGRALHTPQTLSATKAAPPQWQETRPALSVAHSADNENISPGPDKSQQGLWEDKAPAGGMQTKANTSGAGEILCQTEMSGSPHYYRPVGL